MASMITAYVVVAYAAGLNSYEQCGCGPSSHGLCGYGLYGYGLYTYGLHNYGLC